MFEETFPGANSDRVRKEKYRNAIQAIAKGEYTTITAASEKYEVSEGTLSMLLKLGRNFIGKGQNSHIFSVAEEKLITNKILKNLEKGDVSRQYVKQILLEEFEIIKREKPERNLPNTLHDKFLEGFLIAY